MLVGFLRTVLFITMFYYLFKFIGRYLLPFLLKKGVENMQKKQQEQFNRYSDEQRKREGEVTIKTNQKPKNSVKESGVDSEYVDFEEVE
jgi:hypothetical protein